jgi:hypothetical protein
MNKINSIVITISETTDPNTSGYDYDIYGSSNDKDNDQWISGGLCKGTLADAVQMAKKQAQTIIMKQN